MKNQINAKDDGTTRLVTLIEDNVELRTSYALILKGVGGYKIIGEYDSCEAALKNIEKDIPDIILIDLTLPGMNGISGITRIKKLLPAVRIVVITVHDEPDFVFNALCAGAIGYLTKDSSYEQILSAINEVFDGGAPMSAKIASMVIKSFHVNPRSPLTERETDVLKQLAQGKTYDYIADTLFISKDTVKTHIRHIYEKLQVDNKSDALIKARKDSLV
ncbi:MAG: response regulator transcription factor [Cyclobacteriaceae bacterium]|nr:response regulator transcription factor [Cyclobacteriaceae bacterium]HQQ83260.1 response regulator transcription factor [Cyclobacteriaceae bacterium]